MLFSSTIFLLIFLPVLLILYFNPIIKNRQYRNGVLLVFSIAFYAWGEPIFVAVLLFSIALNLILTGKMEKSLKYKKPLFVTIIVWNVLLLFVMKYLSFFSRELCKLVGIDTVDQFGLQIALPLGISFFTFQMLSYVIDVYRGNVSAQKSFFKLALYISMFPQLVAGPIVRYSSVADEIDNRQESMEDVGKGAVRFVYGLSKKILLANYLGMIADNMFYDSGRMELPIFSACLGAVAYTLQIYFDFSGYSDMAVGLGRIFGFHFAENFDHPYLANTITEFWRKWHISLSSWFRDYVYIPLGGNRCTASRNIFNLFLVWLLTGLWHGADWTFVVWGLGYFILLIIEKYILKGRVIPILSRLYTLVFVCLLWVLFRADSLSLAGRYLGQMFGSAHILYDADSIRYFTACLPVLAAGIVCSFPIKKYLFELLGEKLFTIIAAVLAIPLFLLCVSSCMTGSYNPFIYFNF